MHTHLHEDCLKRAQWKSAIQGHIIVLKEQSTKHFLTQIKFAQIASAHNQSTYKKPLEEKQTG